MRPKGTARGMGEACGQVRAVQKSCALPRYVGDGDQQKGLRKRIRPMCTLSQNGYGDIHSNATDGPHRHPVPRQPAHCPPPPNFHAPNVSPTLSPVHSHIPHLPGVPTPSMLVRLRAAQLAWPHSRQTPTPRSPPSPNTFPAPTPTRTPGVCVRVWVCACVCVRARARMGASVQVRIQAGRYSGGCSAVGSA